MRLRRDWGSPPPLTAPNPTTPQHKSGLLNSVKSGACSVSCARGRPPHRAARLLYIDSLSLTAVSPHAPQGISRRRHIAPYRHIAFLAIYRASRRMKREGMPSPTSDVSDFYSLFFFIYSFFFFCRGRADPSPTNGFVYCAAVICGRADLFFKEREGRPLPYKYSDFYSFFFFIFSLFFMNLCLRESILRLF